MKSNRLFSINISVMGKFLFFFGLGISMMSCGEDIDLFIPRASQPATGNINRLITRLQSDISGDISYTFHCPCNGGTVYEVDKDLVLVIPPDFVDLSEYPCTTGSFDTRVTVCDTKGEILLTGIPTVSERKLLESRLELNIQITDGDKPVKLKHGQQIRILVNDPDPRERMELFYGQGDQWLQADQNPDTWDNVTNTEWYFQDSMANLITGFGYECFSDSLNWVNVDAYFDIPEEHRTPVCVDLPGEFSNKNATVFMVFNDYKSILAMHGDSASMQFCEPYGSTPIGFNVTFVVLAEMGEDNYFFAAKSTTITPNHTEFITPLKTPYEAIKAYITKL